MPSIPVTGIIIPKSKDITRKNFILFTNHTILISISFSFFLSIFNNELCTINTIFKDQKITNEPVIEKIIHIYNNIALFNSKTDSKVS